MSPANRRSRSCQDHGRQLRLEPLEKRLLLATFRPTDGAELVAALHSAIGPVSLSQSPGAVSSSQIAVGANDSLSRRHLLPGFWSSEGQESSE